MQTTHVKKRLWLLFQTASCYPGAVLLNLKKKISTSQVEKPVLFAVFALLLSLLSVPWIAQLELNSAWTALLPEDAPSVRDLELAQHRYGGRAGLMIALEGNNRSELKRAAAKLGPKLEAFGDPIRHVAYSTNEYAAFAKKNRYLFAELDFLETLRDDLEDRIDYEHAKDNPFFVDLGETPPTFDSIATRVRKKGEDAEAAAPNAKNDGYFMHQDGKLLVIFMQTTLADDQIGEAKALISKIENLCASTLKDNKTVSFQAAGFLPEMLAEHAAITEELVVATSLTLLLVLLSIYVFFRQLRVIPILGIFLIPPVAITFGIAEFAVDYLNTSTAFLGSVVVGNGVNPGVIWLARYFEERRRGKNHAESIEETHRAVWSGTFTASMAAAIAYASLTFTDFRGFRDFGIIGSIGMILCWIASIVWLPAIITLFERVFPIRLDTSTRDDGRSVYGRVLFKMAAFRVRTTVAISALLSIISIGIVAFAIVNDPMEYDLSNLRSVRESSKDVGELNDRINDFASRTAIGMITAVLTDSLDVTERLEHRFEKERDAKNATVGAVNTVFDLLPSQQKEKIEVLAEIRDSLLAIRPKVTEAEKRDIDEWIPPEHIVHLVPKDLPPSMLAPFTERDGTIGRVIATEPMTFRGNWDGRELIAWTNSLRQLSADEGANVALAGRPPVFADMLATIWKDGPIAIAFAFLATIILVILTFRSGRNRLLLIVTLLIGIAWMGAAMALAGMHINFLNFLAFPITFGNGVDYGVNVVRRMVDDQSLGIREKESIRSAVMGTGGAVALCSLTTIFGYLSLYASGNLAINSFGAAMAISEITCVLAAVVALPAYLLMRAKSE